MQTLLLLDLDGTLIDTPHYEAWRRAALRIGVENFTYQEYVAHIAGRTRWDGASRLLELKQFGGRGASDDACYGSLLAQAKQVEFLRLAAQTRLFDDALRLLKRVKTSGQSVRFYTASENAARLFDTALRQSEKSLSWDSIVRQRRGQTREAFLSSLAGARRPETIVVIDDAPHAVDAACRLGMQGYQIRRSAYEPAAADPRACTVQSLDDIAVPISPLVKDMK